MTIPAQSKYRTVYLEGDRLVAHEFEDKATNDDFYYGMKIMGVVGLAKDFYHPIIKEWFRYHNTNPELLLHDVV